MNNNKRFVIFVVALFFGFSFSVGLKCANEQLVDKVYKQFIADQAMKTVLDKGRLNCDQVENAVKNITRRILANNTLSSDDEKDIEFLREANVLTPQQAIDVKEFLKIILFRVRVQAESHRAPLTATTYATKARRFRHDGNNKRPRMPSSTTNVESHDLICGAHVSLLQVAADLRARLSLSGGGGLSRYPFRPITSKAGQFTRPFAVSPYYFI